MAPALGFVVLQVGGRVKGRVLTVDAGSSKATLTLKKSMLKDKRKPITSYQEVRRDTPNLTSKLYKSCMSSCHAKTYFVRVIHFLFQMSFSMWGSSPE